MLINQIYEQLIKDLGPQGWWPGDNTLEIIIGAVLTQSVNWSNVEKAITKMKAADVLNEEFILSCSTEELGDYIRSTLYYRQKARKLKVLFNWLNEQCQFDYDQLFSRPAMELRPQMLSLWGMGKETVDSILCYAGELPVIVIDAYTRRIFYRLGLTPEDASYDELQDLLTICLPRDVKVYNEMHALLVRVGADYCRNKKPRCQLCPLNNKCNLGKQEIIA
ncbi:MAG: endonuclease III domain-containing protein [Methylocystaceae bacterium]